MIVPQVLVEIVAKLKVREAFERANVNDLAQTRSFTSPALASVQLDAKSSHKLLKVGGQQRPTTDRHTSRHHGARISPGPRVCTTQQ
jgi:hypothetical protein